MDLNASGFLGTNATLLSDLSLVVGILVGLILTLGAIMAVRKQFGLHRALQTVGVTLNILQVLLVMVGRFAEAAVPGIPDRLSEAFYQVAAIHALVGLLAFALGTFVMLRGNNLVPQGLRFSNYKLYMRSAYGLYMVVTVLGILTYYSWYVVPSAVATDEETPAPLATEEVPPAPAATEEAPAPPPATDEPPPLPASTEESPLPAGTEETSG
jgi:uncharacterized membrane protein YozB (DUF420 family)